jgi:UDP-N-acetylmuramate dehydrogenase
MRVREHVSLAPFTTLQVGGMASRMVEADSDADLVAVLHDAKRRREPVFILGRGSNVVVADAGFPGTVAKPTMRGIDAKREGDRVLVDVAAGEDWDDLVNRAVDEGWSGIECMSGIPGLVGATPIQNVGAYGQEVSETIVSVRVYDRTAAAFDTLPPEACRFGYRASIFKRNERWVVTSVRFAFAASQDAAPIRYAELARALSVPTGHRPSTRAVRQAVLALRRAKGMLLEPDDPESVSAGSFFVNPIVSNEIVDEVARRAGERPAAFPEAAGRTKLAAAWLVERAGFQKGWSLGNVGVSRKHALALVNRGGATARELLEAATRIRSGVHERFGVLLEPEPVLVGCSLG